MTQDPSSSPAGGTSHAEEEQLALYALNPAQAADAAGAHIATCAACRAEVAQLRAVLTAGDATRDRAGCVDVERLTAYALGETHGAEQRAIAAHVRTCLHCAADVALTRAELLAAARPARAPLAALRRALATLVAPPAAPALALRDSGGDATEPRVYIADELEATVRHLADDRRRGRFILVGALSVSAQSPAHPVLLARLLRAVPDQPDGAPALMAEVPVTLDAFEFEGVAAGSYQIELLCADRLIVVSPITL